MPIDASIYTAFAPAAKSVQDYQDQELNRQVRLQGLQQNQLALMGQRQKLDEYNRGLQEQATIRNALAGLGGNATDDQRIAALKSTGLPGGFTQADALQKAMLERTKTEAESRAKQAEALGRLISAQGDLAGRVFANPTPEAAASAIANMKALTAQLGVQMDFSGDEAALSSFQTPDQIRQWAAGHALQAKELLPKLQTVNVGNAQLNQAVDPLTGKVTNTATNQVFQSPDNAATVGATIRGQNMTDARERELGGTVYDADRGLVVNRATKTATPVTTADGKPVTAKQPENVKKELASIDAQMSVLDGAIKDVKATPDAFSFKRGLATMTGPLTESVAGRLDSSAERDARSYVFNVVSKVINERAGAAQSAQELARLRSFLPAETDNSQQIVDKLESFKGYLADLGNGYQQGRYTPQAKPGAGAGSTTVKLPNGKVLSFPSAEAAANFRKEAGL